MLKELEELLNYAGYDPADAKRLLDEGMGPYELEARLLEKDGLERSHGLRKRPAVRIVEDLEKTLETVSRALPLVRALEKDPRFEQVANAYLTRMLSETGLLAALQYIELDK